jgi:hypothetical protein
MRHIFGASRGRMRITFQFRTDFRQLSPTKPIEFIIIDSGPQVFLRVSCLLEYGLPIFLSLFILFLIPPDFNGCLICSGSNNPLLDRNDRQRDE